MYAHTCMQTMRMGVGGCRGPNETARPSRANNKQSGWLTNTSVFRKHGTFNRTQMKQPRQIVNRETTFETAFVEFRNDENPTAKLQRIQNVILNSRIYF